jgi:hypothetical protein
MDILLLWDNSFLLFFWIFIVARSSYDIFPLILLTFGDWDNRWLYGREHDEKSRGSILYTRRTERNYIIQYRISECTSNEPLSPS